MALSPSDRKSAIAAEVPRLNRYALALLRDRRDAEDLVHDCVVRALANLTGWRDGDNPRKWLFTILHNLYIDRVRAQGRMPMQLSLDAVDLNASSVRPNEEVTRHEINTALQALPAEQRQCVLLIGLEGLSYAEASEVLGVPVGTIMSRLSRGREKLRELLDHQVQKPTLRRIK